MKRRRSFEAGHKRKFLLVVDDSTEVESALYYAASRVQRASGIIVMLYIIVPETYTHWVGVRERQIEEETATAKALFRLFRRKLNQDGFEDVETQEAIREGQKAEQIVQAIAEDDDIAILVLGASTDAKGPGPLVSSLAVGKSAGSFPIPITVVPGNLALEDIKSLA
jgi:nucleotide-binding universal stress UspA family protein